MPQDVDNRVLDNIPITRYMQPTLSTVGASRALWGTYAVTQLINFIEDQVPFAPFRIPTQFIPRASSQKYPILQTKEKQIAL